MLALQDEKQPVDLHTLSEHLNDRRQLDASAARSSSPRSPTSRRPRRTWSHHARIVRDKAIKRSLIRVADEIVESGYEEAGRAEQLLDAAESKIFDISRSEARTTSSGSYREPARRDGLRSTTSRRERGGQLTGVPTGYRDLDADTGGLQPGELVDHRGAARAWARPRSR